MKKITALKVTTVFTLSLTSTTAFAEINAQDVLTRLTAQLGKQGLELTASSAALNGGNDVILSGVKLGLDGGDGLDIAELPLQGVTQDSDGSYTVSQIELPEFTTMSAGNKLTFKGATIEDYFIASTDLNDPVLSAGYYKKLTFGKLNVSEGDNTIFDFSGGVVNVSDYEPGGVVDYDMAFKDMVFNSSALRGNAKQTFDALGYEQISGGISGEGSWDTSSGLMDVSSMVFATEDAADLTLSFKMGGYTPELALAMQDLQAQNAGNEQAQGIAMLGLMQQLDVRSFSLKMDDNSITGRLLDFFGKQQGMNRESTVAFAKGMLPLGLARLGNQEFATQTTAEVGKYLDDPKNITISAMPENPVPLAQVVGSSAGGNLGPAIDLLNVKVKANQ